jgi:hypothetical protein
MAKLTKRRSVYIAIMAAYEAGRGVHLTADEVHRLAFDDAIVTRAAVELPDDDEFVTDPTFTWTRAFKRAGLTALKEE